MKRQSFILLLVGAIAGCKMSTRETRGLVDDLEMVVQRASKENQNDVASVLSFLQGAIVGDQTRELAEVCADWAKTQQGV